MVTRKKYDERVEHQYPPRCKTDLVHLVDDCSVYYHDWRDLFSILTDIDYRVVAPGVRGTITGYKHDRTRGEFLVNIQTEDGNRESVDQHQILKLEPVDTIEYYPHRNY